MSLLQYDPMAPEDRGSNATKGSNRKSIRRTADVVAGIERQITALGARMGNEAVEELAAFKRLESAVQSQYARAVAGMREHGVTDGQIAEVLGVSRQAVSKRWPDGGRRVGAAGIYGRRVAPAPASE